VGRVFVTNHVLVGSMIGLALPRRPVAAFSTGVASHYACDAVPHWGLVYNPGLFLKYAVVDGLVGLSVMTAITRCTPASERMAVLAGMLGAAFPDADKPAELFFGRSPFPVAFDDFHSRIQRESPDRLWSEIAFGIGMCGLLAVLRRRSRW
jgi:hypothetical protein